MLTETIRQLSCKLVQNLITAFISFLRTAQVFQVGKSVGERGDQVLL